MYQSMSTSTSSPRLDRFPFTIRQLNPSTHLIREKDKYAEFPHIYAKVVFQTRGSTRPALIVLSDSGCGTSKPFDHFTSSTSCDLKCYEVRKIAHHGTYDLGNFLRQTINPNGKIPYLVVTTHCHYDHILGLKHLPSTSSGKTTVLSSSHKRSFIVPRSHLADHSLCDAIGVSVPKYDIGIWAHDLQNIAVNVESTEFNLAQPGKKAMDTGLTIIHTPGHTPDSLTWYDRAERYICVGDSLYERESPDSKDGGEPPMPTIFDIESDLLDWWESLKKVIAFVTDRNVEFEESFEDVDEWVVVNHAEVQGKKKKRVILGAAHVTADVDAEECLLEMQDFMRKVLRGEIPSCSLGEERGEEACLWDEAFGDGDGKGRFSVKAPLRIIEEGREGIPHYEYEKHD